MMLFIQLKGSVNRLLEVRFDKTVESIWHITWYNLLSWAAELCYCWHKNVTVEWETWRPYTCTTTTPHGQFPVNLLTIHTDGNWHYTSRYSQTSSGRNSHPYFYVPIFNHNYKKQSLFLLKSLVVMLAALKSLQMLMAMSKKTRCHHTLWKYMVPFM